MNQKEIVRTLVMVTAVVFLGLVWYLIFTNHLPWQILPTSSATPTPSTALQTYSDPTIEFKYSNALSVKKEAARISVNHSLAYSHPNLCDFRGDASLIDRLTDFDVTVQVINKTLTEAVKRSNEHCSNWFQQRI